MPRPGLAGDRRRGWLPAASRRLVTHAVPARTRAHMRVCEQVTPGAVHARTHAQAPTRPRLHVHRALVHLREPGGPSSRRLARGGPSSRRPAQGGPSSLRATAGPCPPSWPPTWQTNASNPPCFDVQKRRQGASTCTGACHARRWFQTQSSRFARRAASPQARLGILGRKRGVLVLGA